MKEFAVIVKRGRDVSRLAELFWTYEDAEAAAAEYKKTSYGEQVTPQHFRGCHGGRKCKGDCR